MRDINDFEWLCRSCHMKSERRGFQPGHKLNQGENHPLYGKKFSKESRQKMSISQRGKIRSDETKQKLKLAQIRRREREKNG